MKNNRLISPLTVCTLLFAIAVPLVSTTVLGGLYINLSSDITIPPLLPEIINYVSMLIDVAAVYALMACLSFAVIADKNRRLVVLLALISPPVVYAVTMLVDLAFWSRSILSVSYILSNATNCIYELIRSAVVLFVCARIAKKQHPEGLELLAKRGNLSRGLIAVTAVMAAFMLAANAAETVTLLMTVGAPINVSETVYLVMPYITTMIYTILGYLFMYALLRGFSGNSLQPECAVDDSADHTA